jgi:hypothetical protein
MGAFGGDEVAGPHAFEDLVVAVTREAHLDGAPGKAAAVGGDPGRHRAVALAHHPIQRNCRRPHRLAGADHEGGEHAGAQLVLGIFDVRAHQHPVRVGIDRRCDGGDVTFERPVRERHDADLDLLADTEGRAVGLGDVGEHPHGRNIGDRIGRRQIGRLYQPPRRGIPSGDPARYGARDDEGRVDVALGDHAVHFGVALAEDAHCVAGGPQGAFGSLLLGDGLLEILLEIARVSNASSGADWVGELQHAGGRDQGRRRLSGHCRW